MVVENDFLMKARSDFFPPPSDGDQPLPPELAIQLPPPDPVAPPPAALPQAPVTALFVMGPDGLGRVMVIQTFLPEEAQAEAEAEAQPEIDETSLDRELRIIRIVGGAVIALIAVLIGVLLQAD